MWARFEMIERYLRHLLLHPTNPMNALSMDVHRDTYPEEQVDIGSIDFDYSMQGIDRNLNVTMRSRNREQAEFITFSDEAYNQNAIEFPFISPAHQHTMSDQIFVDLFKQWFRYSKVDYNEDRFMHQVNRPMEAVIKRGSGGPLIGKLSQELRDRIAEMSRLTV